MTNVLLKYVGFFCCLFLIRYYNFFHIVLPVREFVPSGSEPTISTFLIYNFGLSVFYYLIKFVIVGAILTTGLFLNKTHHDKANFGQLFTLGVSAEFIFLLSDLVKSIYFTFIATQYTELQFANLYPLSIFNLIDSDLGVLTYAFQILNGFEFLYFLYLARGISILIQSSFKEALGIVLYSYGSLLILWVLIMTYFNL